MFFDALYCWALRTHGESWQRAARLPLHVPLVGDHTARSGANLGELARPRLVGRHRRLSAVARHEGPLDVHLLQERRHRRMLIEEVFADEHSDAADWRREHSQPIPLVDVLSHAVRAAERAQLSMYQERLRHVIPQFRRAETAIGQMLMKRSGDDQQEGMLRVLDDPVARRGSASEIHRAFREHNDVASRGRSVFKRCLNRGESRGYRLKLSKPELVGRALVELHACVVLEVAHPSA